MRARAGIRLVLGAVVVGAVLAPASGSAAGPTTCSKTRTQYISSYQSPGVASLGLPQAAETSSGRGVVVAVVDSGVDARNAHLGSALVRGISLVDKSPRTDADGHGTVIAGIIAARPVTDPKSGDESVVVGAAPEAEIMPVQVYRTREPDKIGSPSTTRLAQGIRFAVQNGARVIAVALSTGPDDPDLSQLRDAVRFAQRKDVLVVASAGDFTDSSQARNQLRYPAGFPGVLGVAATDSSGATGDWGYRGDQVAVSAPGSLVPSAYFGRGDCVFGIKDGKEAPESSWSTGFVAGLAAQLRAAYPTESSALIGYRIEMTASRPEVGERDQDQGWGLIQPAEALGLIPSASDLGPALPGSKKAEAASPTSGAQVQQPRADQLADDRQRVTWLVLGALALGGAGLIARPLTLRLLRRRHPA